MKKATMKKATKKTKIIDIMDLSRDDLGNLLLKIAKEKNLIWNKQKNYYSCPWMDKDELTSTMNITIASVLRSIDVYRKRLNGEPLDENDPNLGEEIDLSTVGMVTGYFKSAWDNNVSKIYYKSVTKGKNAETVSHDAELKDENDATAMIANKLKVDTLENRIESQERILALKKIFYALRSVDKKFNHHYKMKKNFNEKKLSKLAYVFLYMIDPKNDGKYSKIKEKISYSPHIYEKKVNDVSYFIKKNFSEELDMIYSYWLKQDGAYGELLRPKHTENYYNQSCEYQHYFDEYYTNTNYLNNVVNIKLKKDQIALRLNCKIFRKNNGQTEVLEHIIFPLIVNTKKISINDAKSSMLDQYKVEISKMQQSAIDLKHAALVEVYGNNPDPKKKQ